jgi:hypothetical protein
MKVLSTLNALLGRRSPEPTITGQANAAGSDLFVHLGKVTALTGKDENGSSGDGGEIKGWEYKMSS